MRGLFAQTRRNGTTGGNFSYIYTDHTSRNEFKNFLVNVFHLYPEDDLHQLIEAAVAAGASDEEVYRVVQQQLDDIQDWLARVAQNLETLDYDGKRLALDALGVQVRLWDKTREPRYEIAMHLDPTLVISTVEDSAPARSASACRSPSRRTRSAKTSARRR